MFTINQSFIKPIAAVVLLLGASVLMTSCKQEGCTDPDSINYDPKATENVEASCEYPVLSLDIQSVVNGEVFSFDQVYQINEVATKFTTAQYYLSNPGVMTNGVMEIPGTYLLVKADQSLYEVGQITGGQKTMLSFGVGVDSTQNFLDPTLAEAPLNPQSPNMHWSWNSGYIFIRLEGQVDTDADDIPDTNFELHVGGMNQYTLVTLEVMHEANEVDSRIEITADFARFLDGIDLKTNNVTHTMDNMPLAMAIVANISKVFSDR